MLWSYCGHVTIVCQSVLEQLQRRHEAAHQDLRGGARRVLRQVRLLANESAAAGHVTRARPLIGCYVAGSPTDHEQCGGGACPLEGGVSSPGEVTVALGGWRDDWLQTVTILHPDTGREVGIDSVDSIDTVDSIDSMESVDSIDRREILILSHPSARAPLSPSGWLTTSPCRWAAPPSSPAAAAPTRTPPSAGGWTSPHRGRTGSGCPSEYTLNLTPD